MDTRQIERILRSCALTRRYFEGVFAADRLRLPTHYPASIVANLDESKESGSHWVGIFAKSPSEVLYFDSYGMPPDGKILHFLRNFARIRPNNFPVQSVISNVCAAYCVYFIYMCSRGENYADILSRLAHKQNSDAFVRNFMYELVAAQ
jgi:hypothetical protein